MNPTAIDKMSWHMKSSTVVMAHLLAQEVIVIIGCKILCSRSMTAERLAVTDFLQVVETTGDAAVSVGVERIKIDRCSAVNA